MESTFAFSFLKEVLNPDFPSSRFLSVLNSYVLILYKRRLFLIFLFYGHSLLLCNYNFTNITNINKTFSWKTMSLILNARKWWECSGDELWAMNLRRPNFVAQDKYHRRCGNQALTDQILLTDCIYFLRYW